MSRRHPYHTILRSYSSGTFFAVVSLLAIILSVGTPESSAQQGTATKAGSVDNAKHEAKSKKPADKKSAVDTAGQSSDTVTDNAEAKGQFRKQVSPSGLQMGLTDPETTKELPEELREFAKQGALASAAKQWEKAKIAYQGMVEAAPDHPLALANLGTVEFQLEEYAAASDHLRQSLAFAPSVAHHWLVLALCYYQLEDLDLAMSCLFRARHEDKTDPRVHLYLAVMARDYGWQSAAEIELQRAIMLDPQYIDAHYNLAMLYLERDPPAYELARRHYYFALDLGSKPDPEIEKLLREATLKR